MKKEWDNQRNSFRKSCKGAGAMQNDPCPKNKNNAFFDLLLQKNERSAISKQPKSASQNTPFCPFSKGTQNCTNHIALIICALQTIFCVFAFLCFCVLNFNCEMGRHRKGLPSGGGRLKGVFNKCWF